MFAFAFAQLCLHDESRATTTTTILLFFKVTHTCTDTGTGTSSIHRNVPKTPTGHHQFSSIVVSLQFDALSCLLSHSLSLVDYSLSLGDSAWFLRSRKQNSPGARHKPVLAISHTAHTVRVCVSEGICEGVRVRLWVFVCGARGYRYAFTVCVCVLVFRVREIRFFVAVILVVVVVVTSLIWDNDRAIIF